ncbi:MAG: hypothetical protein VW600_04725 [Ferrovibrio sp.]
MQALLALAVETVPRALGFCDRDAGSVTAGCCDRSYWHYRLIDVANARYQEIGLLLALAHATPAPGNPFAGRQKIADWSRMIWRHWLRQKNGDGSLSEVYPNERSFCATAFTAAAFVETVSLLGGAAAWQRELAEARPVYLWLAENENPGVANQMAASWSALDGYAQLTHSDRIAAAAAARRERVLKAQRADGAFLEYGGLDAGYQTVSMSALVRVLERNPADRELRDALAAAENVIRPLLKPDGDIDPGRNSRSTQYIYPYALKYLQSELLGPVLTGIESGTVLRPTWLDDRYCHALAADYFLAYRRSGHGDDAAAPDRI